MVRKVVVVLPLLILSTALSMAREEAKVPADTKIVLERTACYGTCPIYTVTIDANGNTEFVGQDFVAVKGRQEKTIPVDNVASILAEVEKAKFFELNGRYDYQDWTDSPSAFIAITADGRTKRIEHYYGCKSANEQELKALTDLAKKIDEAAGTAEWVKKVK